MLDWSKFLQLAGAADVNFERLCRALVKLHYGQYGVFAARINQPGVEFHLHLISQCAALGNPGRWWGWQCRWYDLESGKDIGATRRKKIEESIKTTKRHLPDLTDWVLWTHHPLTAKDQKWFYGLNAGMTLHLSHGQDVDDLLSGPAEMLRKTYFGELVLSPADLAGLHEKAVSRVKARWIPEAHQKTEAEASVRKMLAEPEAWDGLQQDSEEIRDYAGAIQKHISKQPKALRAMTRTVVAAAKDAVQFLSNVQEALKKGDLDLLIETLGISAIRVDPKIADVPRALRAANDAAGPLSTNAVQTMREAFGKVSSARKCIDTRLVSVLADAGGGKTQLAAQLTAPAPGRPAGILLHGRDLHAGKTLDDLARGVNLGGNPIPSMEALIGALDAAGQRAKRRLPLVIDGLNESEDPRDWRPLLAELDTALKRYPYVLVVVTLRTGARDPSEGGFHRRRHQGAEAARATFADQALPDDVERLDLDGFGKHNMEAVHKYFTYYKIDSGDTELPVELFQHPLTLRIFCEVANPKRDRQVGPESVPRSLVALFDQYIARSCVSIADRSPRSRRYLAQDVRTALSKLGAMLWDLNDREVPQREFSAAIGEPSGLPWDLSMVHLLEQEGLVLRNPTDQVGEWNVIPVYDELGGYLIAAAKVAEAGGAGVEEWLKNPETVTKFRQWDEGGTQDTMHPLSADIFRNLVGLVPKITYKKQLWQLVDEPLKTRALVRAAFLEQANLDSETVKELESHLLTKKAGWNEVFVAIMGARSTPGHPFNADFLDHILQQLTVADRDLLWTEWLRSDLNRAAGAMNRDNSRWSRTNERGEGDRLRALSMKWMLTSTQNRIRDHATKALYRYGRGAPELLFEMTLATATLNDPSVFERMLAASYGVCTTLSVGPASAPFIKGPLPTFARNVHAALFAPGAAGRTTHIRIRDYGNHIVELAVHHHRKLFSDAELSVARQPFTNGGRIEWQEHDRNRKLGAAGTPYRYEFENEEVGYLVRDRRSYDFAHEEYKSVRAKILWRVMDLGWSVDKFGVIDERIEKDPVNRAPRRHLPRFVERYGQKYLQIAYEEMAGMQQDAGALDVTYLADRGIRLDIDPTFSRADGNYLIREDLLGRPGMSVRSWRKNGAVPNLSKYLRVNAVRHIDAPVVLLDGNFYVDDPVRRHRIFIHVRGLLVPRASTKGIVKDLKSSSPDTNPVPDKVDTAGFLAGEVPWSTDYPSFTPTSVEFLVREYYGTEKVKREIYAYKGQEFDYAPEDLAALVVKSLAGTEMDESADAKAEDFGLPTATGRYKEVNVRKRMEECRSYEVQQPVISMRGHNHTELGERIDGLVLERQIAVKCKLVNVPGTFDLQQRDGIRVTSQFSYSDPNHHRAEAGIYMREDVLQSYLDNQGLDLVWSVWGAREGSIGSAGDYLTLEEDGRRMPSGYFRKVHIHKTAKTRT